MLPATIVIQPINLRAATSAEYQALNTFENALRAERLPDDPPLPLSETSQRWQNFPAFFDLAGWGAWSADQAMIIAAVVTFIRRTEDNQHLLYFELGVLPAFRRQGIGWRLLAHVVDRARGEQRRLLLTETHGRAPAGAQFMQRLHAQPGLVAHTNQLVLAALDRDLLCRWQAQGAAHAHRYVLDLWCGAYPETQLTAITNLCLMMNSEPRDQLEVEDFQLTPDRLRQQEKYLAAIGVERWTFYATERATGDFVGYTEVFWHPNRPTILEQGATGVFPAHRNQGLGRWLKAAMLDKVLRERPQVQFVRTGNADSNAAMLAINRALGFQPYLSTCLWQAPTAQVAHYLGLGDLRTSK